jgi:hypothetical protein
VASNFAIIVLLTLLVVYAASAMAGNSVIRSFLGGTLPLAGPAMYTTLGPHWAGTLLGLIQIAIIPIPVLFYKYGHKIRMKSTLISSMQRDKDRLENKRRSGVRSAIQEKEEENMANVVSKTAEP